MKGFFPTFLVVCAVIGGAGWYFYDPYLKPYFDRAGKTTLTDQDRRITETTPATPASAKEKAAPAPVATKPSTPAPAPAPAVKPKSELDLALEKKYPMPQILPLLTIVDQWRNVPVNAYPPEIFSKQTIPFELVVDGKVLGSSNVAPGTPLKPLRLEGDQIVIASPANPAMNKKIPVDQTDFKERIEARYQQFVDAKTKEIETKRARVRQIIEADPAKLAMLTGTGAPNPAAAPEDSGDPRFAPVKASLRAGEAASVTLEEAKSFHWNGTETIKGAFAGSYETVTVNFEVSTIFGKFPTEYKALLKGGKVHAWIDPFTEDRI